MRAFLIVLSVILIVFSVSYGIEKIDVVYLKNGDIRKGIITENVPNDYIKIETADGSVFTIKYADIERMTKEEKQATQPVYAPQEAREGLMARNGDFGITAGLWLGGEISFSDYYNGTVDKEAGFIGRIFYDAYLMDRLATGIYFNISPASIENNSEGATMFEIGGSIKPRFPLANGAAVIKIGLNFGYRFYSSDIQVLADSKNMGLNASVEVQFDAKSIVVPYFEIGMLSQPVGGTTGETDITFAPIFYFGGGIAF